MGDEATMLLVISPIIFSVIFQGSFLKLLFSLRFLQTTPLSIALQKDNLKCAELLLSTNVDINFPDDKGSTVLMNQLLSNFDKSSLEKVRFLVGTKGADVTIKDMTGSTAVCSPSVFSKVVTL